MQTKLNPTNVTVWTRQQGCPWCDRAKALLKSKGIAYQEKVVGPTTMDAFVEETRGAKTVPQVIFDGEIVGGFEQLQKALTSDNAKITKVV